MTDRVLILAAGQSSRMRGKDKLLETINGQPLLRRQTVMSMGLGWPVTVALPRWPHPRYDIVADLAVQVASVRASDEGIGGTLRECIASMPDDTDAVLILLPDLPEITLEDLQRVVAARDANPDALVWRGATAQGLPGHPILFDAETFPAFADLAGDDGGKSVISRFHEKTTLVHLPGDRARRDLDTPEDWAAWRAQQQQ